MSKMKHISKAFKDRLIRSLSLGVNYAPLINPVKWRAYIGTGFTAYYQDNNVGVYKSLTDPVSSYSPIHQVKDCPIINFDENLKSIEKVVFPIPLHTEYSPASSVHILSCVDNSNGTEKYEIWQSLSIQNEATGPEITIPIIQGEPFVFSIGAFSGIPHMNYNPSSLGFTDILLNRLVKSLIPKTYSSYAALPRPLSYKLCLFTSDSGLSAGDPLHEVQDSGYKRSHIQLEYYLRDADSNGYAEPVLSNSSHVYINHTDNLDTEATNILVTHISIAAEITTGVYEHWFYMKHITQSTNINYFTLNHKQNYIIYPNTLQIRIPNLLYY